MEEANKLPLKRVELSLTKFNEVAIPHHLDLLRQHRMNILKYEECGDYRRVSAEQTHARRVASQLRALLGEVEGLRIQVASQHWEQFDKLTQRSRELTLKAIMDYLERSPLSVNRVEDSRVSGSAVSTESVGVVAHAVPTDHDDQLIQLQIDEQSRTEQREAVLGGWRELQREVGALHDAWQLLHRAALTHRHHVTEVAESIDVAADNVQVARTHLAGAERLRAVGWGAGGAALGAAVGGPLGLVLGAKLGAAALLAGSVLGYFSGNLLGKKRQEQIDIETKDRSDKND